MAFLFWQNHNAVTLLQILGMGALALPAGAGEHEAQTYGPVLEACYAEAATSEERAACIGQMSSVCMDTEEGGHSTLGMVSCLSAEADAWDRWLNTEYVTARAGADAVDIEEAKFFPEFARRAETLLAAQRAWIVFRDAECDLAYAEWGSGSMRNIAYADCRLQMTAERTLRLRAMREDR
jgi:uncharacterized protein YecT (DUF1311 family)